jgi:hypothetical protein
MKGHDIKGLTDFLIGSVEAARASESPFYHLEFEQFFPEDVYARMLEAMPVADDYRPMSGRAKSNVRDDGTPTRVKIDLFPEYIRNLPDDKRKVWDLVGRVLCSAELQSAFMRRLAGPLQRRFGPGFSETGLYPVPVLTRDIPGYMIPPHTDTRWKGVTVQFYLPHDNAATHVGTIFHRQRPDSSLEKVTQMKFARNGGYAFAVGTDTWHSADPVGQEVETRDSILLTYFVDSGLLRFLRNRGKRVGNFVLNEVRHLTS